MCSKGGIVSLQCTDSLEYNLVEADVPDERLYAALSFKGGTASSRFAFLEPSDSLSEDAWDEDETSESVEIFQANRSFWQVARRYLLNASERSSLREVFLDTSATMIALRADTEEQVLETVQMLFSIEPTREAFETAKTESFRDYLERFSNPLFRFMHKILEQTEANKGFSYTAFTTDFEDISYEEFVAAWQRLIIPENAYLCVMGAHLDSIGDQTEKAFSDARRFDIIPVPATPIVPLDRSMYIELEGTTLSCLGALSFGAASDLTPMEKRFCLELINAHLFDGTGAISIDGTDASIAFTQRVDENLLSAPVWMIEENAYSSCVDTFKRSLAHTAAKYPELYTAEQARGMSFGIDQTFLLSIADRIPYAAFCEKLKTLFAGARQITITQGPALQATTSAKLFDENAIEQSEIISSLLDDLGRA